MKKINISILSLVAIFGFTTSCTNDIDQSYPAINDRPVITLTSDQSSIVELNDEATDLIDENIASYTMTASEAYTTDMKFKIEFLPSESTGSLDDIEVSLDASPIDFGIEGFLAVIAKNTTSASFTITSVFDVLPEGAETFKFKVYPVGDLNGSVADASQTFTLTIGNSTTDSLMMKLDWNGDGTYLGIDNETHDLKDFDFDLEVYDTGFNAVLASYSSSPEEIEFLGSYPDGQYFIVPSFWSFAGAITPMLPINFDVTLTVAKPGVFVKEFDLSSLWNSTAGGADDGNPDGYNVTANFTKTTDVVTGAVTYELRAGDVLDGPILVSGRMADLKAMLQSKSNIKAKALAKAKL